MQWGRNTQGGRTPLEYSGPRGYIGKVALRIPALAYRISNLLGLLGVCLLLALWGAASQAGPGGLSHFWVLGWSLVAPRALLVLFLGHETVSEVRAAPAVARREAPSVGGILSLGSTAGALRPADPAASRRAAVPRLRPQAEGLLFWAGTAALVLAALGLWARVDYYYRHVMRFRPALPLLVLFRSDAALAGTAAAGALAVTAGLMLQGRRLNLSDEDRR